MMGQDFTRRQFVGLIGGLGTIGSAGCSAVEAPSDQRDPRTIEFSGTARDRLIELYQAMSPAVVEVHIPGSIGPGEPSGGSGFMMEDVGVVTNSHVVTDNSSVELRFHDRQWRDGTVLETDPHSDLAVIDTGTIPAGVTALPFDERVPEIGTECMVIGAPLGLGGSASTGIVSGVDRVLPSPSGFSIPAAIQTDAAVNPGNSGGPLVDLDGNVLGVVFAGATENIGFAISGPLATQVLPILADGDPFEHSYMGVRFTQVDPRVASANGLDEPVGIYIDEVLSGGPADGILRGTEETSVVNGGEVPVGGDVIVSIDGTETDHFDAFQTYLALQTNPGDVVTIDIYRDSSMESVDLTLGTRPVDTNTS